MGEKEKEVEKEKEMEKKDVEEFYEPVQVSACSVIRRLQVDKVMWCLVKADVEKSLEPSKKRSKTDLGRQFWTMQVFRE